MQNLLSMCTTRNMKMRKPWTVPWKNSVRKINQHNHNTIKQSRLMGPNDFVLWIEKMNYVCTPGAHTILLELR